MRAAEDTPLLELAGYDVAEGRGVYRWLRPAARAVDPEGSRWRMQLGARYVF